MSFNCQKGELDRFFNRLDRAVEESRPDRQPDRFPSLIRTLFANINDQSTAIYRQIIRVDIEVEYEYFCDDITVYITTRHRFVFFFKYNAQNLVWNWYGSMEDCLPFHSILASSIFYTEISFPFHFLFPIMPWLSILYYY